MQGPSAWKKWTFDLGEMFVKNMEVLMVVALRAVLFTVLSKKNYTGVQYFGSYLMFHAEFIFILIHISDEEYIYFVRRNIRQRL